MHFFVAKLLSIAVMTYAYMSITAEAYTLLVDAVTNSFKLNPLTRSVIFSVILNF